MKMRIYRCGAMRGGKGQDELILLGDVDDIRSLRGLVGKDLEVDIKPAPARDKS